MIGNFTMNKHDEIATTLFWQQDLIHGLELSMKVAVCNALSAMIDRQLQGQWSQRACTRWALEEEPCDVQ